MDLEEYELNFKEGAVRIAIVGDSLGEGLDPDLNGVQWPVQLGDFFEDNQNIDIVDLTKGMTLMTDPKRQNYYSPLFHTDEEKIKTIW